MAKKLSPPDVSKPYHPPRLPASPIRATNAARARRDRPDIDRRNLPGVAEGWSPRELGRYSKGPLHSPEATLNAEQREFNTDPQLRRFERDLDKRPIRTGRSMRGGRR
jgi:hypothetical protein